MAKFRPIKKHRTGLERWKDEKIGKEWRKTGLLIQRKIGKSGKTRSKKEKNQKKPGKRKIFFKWERVSFCSHSNKFWPAHISSVEPIGFEVPWKSRWEIWWLWMLQEGKAAHQQTSDDDGQRGELVKPMEEEEPSLVRKISRAQLDNVLMCAKKRWSGGSGTKHKLDASSWLAKRKAIVMLDRCVW